MKITSVEQFQTLVSEMEKEPAFAKGFRKGLKPLNFESFWREIAKKLNPLGPPVRDGDGWHKVWKDLKFKVKKKLVKNKAEARAAGGIYKQVPLSPLEEAVANLLEFEKHLNPVFDDIEFVIVEANTVEQETRNATSESNVNDDLPTVSTRVRATANSKAAEKEGIELLRTQTEHERCSHYKSIKGYLKDISKYQKRRLLVEEERLKIYKRKTEKEEKLLDLDASIKKKELELLENQLITIEKNIERFRTRCSK